MTRWLFSCGLALTFTVGSVWADSEPGKAKLAAERGREALLGRSFSPAIVGWKGYEDVWRLWGLKEKPADHARAFRERYGLHEAAYPNKGLPMGLREAGGLLGKGIGNDCMLCHASSIAGKPVMGLGNSSIDLQGLFDELGIVQGLKPKFPFPFSNVRGTIEASASAAYLFTFRDADLNLRLPTKFDHCTNTCQDIPAWWHLKKKKTMYHTGSNSTQGVRSLMSFMLSPFNSGEYIKKHEPIFRDIRDYLLTLEPPAYPFPIDEKKAAVGKRLFEQNCARCHGTYGPEGEYPNKVVPLDVIGTDPTLVNSITEKEIKLYNDSWFGKEKGPDGEFIQSRLTRGYQAPPLDGVWATAPYLHNGSVPTVYHMLNSRSRPKIYTRSYRTEKEDYDPVRLGWKFTQLEKGANASTPGIERRKIYDTSQPGRANTGHPFGDKLSDVERHAIIEYLKTL